MKVFRTQTQVEKLNVREGKIEIRFYNYKGN